MSETTKKPNSIKGSQIRAGLSLPDYVYDVTRPLVSRDIIKADREPNEEEIKELRAQAAQLFQDATIQLSDAKPDQICLSSNKKIVK